MPFLLGPLCPRCGQPQASGMSCAACAKSLSPISSIRSVFRFEGVIRNAIHDLKYHNVRAIAPTLAAYLISFAANNPDAPDLIVSVPLHPARYKHRGYNQAALLADELGRVLGTPVSSVSLERTWEGTSQVRTRSLEERRRNVVNAFACTDISVAGKRITLVDDVCTTGATLESCATALKSAGALDICGVTVAREV